jgi:hypothetical protein
MRKSHLFDRLLGSTEDTVKQISFVRGLVATLAIASSLSTSPAAAAGNPDFDSVTWVNSGCDIIGSTGTPSETGLVGDATFPPVFYAQDATYAYFRYRVSGNPSGPQGFSQYAWVALLQSPMGNAFQYQYELALNGKGADDDFGNKSSDNIEIWANTSAIDVDFRSLFNDPAETRLFAQKYNFSSGSTVNTTPLARSLLTGDGSNFDGNADYFIDFAVPVSVLISTGVINDASQLSQILFFPATSTNANNYNKGTLGCSFLPMTDLVLTKMATPASLPVNKTSPLTFAIDVFNNGPRVARGLVIQDPTPFPAYLSGATVNVVSDDPSVTWMITSTSPLMVKVPNLPVGSTVEVQISATASPTCSDRDFMNTADIFATNVMEESASANLHILKADGVEICDGVDNTCNGQVDEGGAALCDDGDPCNGTETCGGAAGCQAGTPPTCDDGNACTVDTCDSSVGCLHTPIPGCTPCNTPSDCNDGNGCTVEGCNAGVCDWTPIPGCVPCTTPGDCNDGNSCTTETCNGGVCGHDPIAGCVPCNSPSDCNDGNACTTETCNGGVCGHDPIAGCVPCNNPSDCDDANACTTETCNGGVCGHDSIAGCVPCTTSADCNDGQGCTTDTCDAGACGHSAVPGCVPCGTPSDCDDQNACTTETCVQHICGHDAIAGCVPCTVPGDCDDQNACTTETCNAGVCGHDAIAGCVPCTTPADCNDQNGCTTETCNGGVCGHDAIAGCVPCTTAADCNDHNGCSDDTCDANGVCQHQARPGCIPCTTTADCNDQNACTTDVCGSDGSCERSTIAGCIPCTTDADCHDGDECTTDACSEGTCQFTPKADCPAKPVEICGNCIDDDGDGLVDAEDPDCCEQPLDLHVKRMKLMPTATATKNGLRLKVKALYADATPAGFDPATADTSIQISDANGQIFCQTVAASHWTSKNARIFKFIDRDGSFAGGLAKGRFKMKRNGKVLFLTRGKKLTLRAPESDDVTVTVRVGNQCSQTKMSLRQAKHALVFP